MITSTSHLSPVGVGVKVGSKPGMGDFFHIGAAGGVEIGDDVIIGPFLTVHHQEQNFDDLTKPIRTQGTTQSPVKVGDDYCIGARVTLLAGTESGPRTVVAAGAVVRGRHSGNEILAGVPARTVKSI